MGQLVPLHLGFNATLTMQTDSSKKQSRSGVLPMKPIKTSARIHPVSQECLQRLCDDPTTTLAGALYKLNAVDP
jgi:trehalose 6-phosphate synthase/phosphatase